ncbi:MAG: hypothetical protein IT244_01225 [Bacteroidia bacterium]|jgi:hypothetical protein|nr:hypothetical protein [Bacteroidia bacterium]
MFSKKLIVLAAFMVSIAAKAQVKHQLGFNSSQFVKQFIVFNSTSNISNNPYLITYRMMTKKINYRFGIGGNYSNTYEDLKGSKYYTNTLSYQSNIRLGIDFKKQISKHWFCYSGLDVVMARNNQLIQYDPKPGMTVSPKKTTRTGKTNGLTSCFTIEYRISDHITVFTEGNLNFSQNKTYENIENPDFPSSSSENHTKTGNINFSSPLSIFFSFIF